MLSRSRSVRLKGDVMKHQVKGVVALWGLVELY
jgi:hypothetical protein